MNKNGIKDIIRKHNGNHGGVMSILEEVQARHGYLSEEALRLVSADTGYPLVDIYGVATFYRAFKLQPQGRHLISVCLGTACHVRGSQTIVEEFERQLGIKAGETTKDRAFSLETVNCLGACALGPIVKVDGQYFSNVQSAQVKRIIAQVHRQPHPAKIDTGTYSHTPGD